MCGIYGVVSSNSENISEHNVASVIDKLRHRGPDSYGIWISSDSRIAFAHRRLSILDLSNAGHQPMISDSKRYVIVYNGEIYNFLELRVELEKSGFKFRGGSDTEIVLAAYQAWGESCLTRFNGMFALAIYDAGDDLTQPSIFFARDRVGKKPLYYKLRNGRFEFASELKAIQHDSEIDLNALNHYLALGYVPDRLCLFKGVMKLPPAFAARLDLNSFEFKSWRYWKLPSNKFNFNQNAEELTDQVQSILSDAVKLRLMGDVPLGVLLSGGLDSSLIASIAAQQSSKPINAFTISFPDTKLDESSYARCVADYLGAKHHVLEVNRPSLNILDELKKFIDEPIADSSLIPTFLVSKLTKEHVTVALGGDGGDELFGGYTHYLASLKDQQRFKYIPVKCMRIISSFATKLPAGVVGRNRLSSLRNGALQQMIWGTPYFDISLRERLLNVDSLTEIGEDINNPEEWLLNLFENGNAPIDRMTRTDFGSVLPDDFLVKVDRASMMNSLEIRCPFLDYRLVEYAFSSIPPNLKIYNNETRKIQRILGKRILPNNLDINRKQGFSIPMDTWLREDKCKTVMDYMQYLPSVINKDEVRSLIKGHMMGRANGSRLYSLIMLAIACSINKI